MFNTFQTLLHSKDIYAHFTRAFTGFYFSLSGCQEAYLCVWKLVTWFLLECSHNEVLYHFPVHFSFLLHNISWICTVFVDPLHSKLKKCAQHKKCADIILCHFSWKFLKMVEPSDLIFHENLLQSTSL